MECLPTCRSKNVYRRNGKKHFSLSLVGGQQTGEKDELL